jgi:hypothetical protein
MFTLYFMGDDQMGDERLIGTFSTIAEAMDAADTSFKNTGTNGPAPRDYEHYDVFRGRFPDNRKVVRRYNGRKWLKLT